MMANSILTSYPVESITEERVKELIRSTPSPGSTIKKNIEYQITYDKFTNAISSAICSNQTAVGETFIMQDRVTQLTKNIPWNATAACVYNDILNYEGANAVILNGVSLVYEQWQHIDTVTLGFTPMISTTGVATSTYKDLLLRATMDITALTLPIYGKFSISDGKVYLSSEPGGGLKTVASVQIICSETNSRYGSAFNPQVGVTFNISGKYDLASYVKFPTVKTYPVEAQY